MGGWMGGWVGGWVDEAGERSRWVGGGLNPPADIQTLGSQATKATRRTGPSVEKCFLILVGWSSSSTASTALTNSALVAVGKCTARSLCRWVGWMGLGLFGWWMGGWGGQGGFFCLRGTHQLCRVAEGSSRDAIALFFLGGRGSSFCVWWVGGWDWVGTGLGSCLAGTRDSPTRQRAKLLGRRTHVKQIEILYEPGHRQRAVIHTLSGQRRWRVCRAVRCAAARVGSCQIPGGGPMVQF